MESFDGLSWTDEKHFRFLNRLESSFLRAVFGDREYGNPVRYRLDRELPDYCDSTQDSEFRPQKKTHLPGGMGIKITDNPEKSRRSTSEQHDPSNDQVVPQLVERSDDAEENNQIPPSHGN